MNYNNKKRNYRYGRSSKENKNLSLVRTGAFYGLQYIVDTEETISLNHGLVSTPNFRFYENNTKVMIDFSDHKNNTLESDILKFWKLAGQGATFAVDSGDVHDSITDDTYVLSGSYYFNNIDKSIVFADVISTGTLSDVKSLYLKKDFITTPSFILSAVQAAPTTEHTTKIVNTLGIGSKNSFSYLGIVIGDYIKLQKSNETYEILNYVVDEEGKEIITISGKLEVEDRESSTTYIGVMISNETSIVADLTDVIIGSCSIQDNYITVQCYNNQTNSQCLCRSSGTQTTSFAAKSTCITAATKAANKIEPDVTSLAAMIEKLNTTVTTIVRTSQVDTGKR